VDTTYLLLSMCTRAEICALAAASSGMALHIMECLTYHRILSWGILYPVYLRARYAVHESAHDTLSKLWFVARLSRACRSCGFRTQRRVQGTLLCASCTRDPDLKCWMIPETFAVDRYHVYVPVHKGPRCRLVFAEHVQTAASHCNGSRKVSRSMIVNGMASRTTCRH